MGVWKNISITNLFELVGGGTPSTKNNDYWGGNIPWLSVVDFANDKRWVDFTEKTITEKGLKNSSTKILNAGDLIISARGTVGELAQLSNPMAFNQSCYGIRAKELTSNDFLYYLLKYSIAKLKKNTHGSVFNTITRDTFNRISVYYPEEREEQNKISNTLSVLDKKIDLLRRQNDTLEQIAQTLFKHWFVDFEFPCLPENYKFSGARKPDDFEKYMIYRAVGGLPIPENNYWFLYVLLCNDGSFYIGITNDLYRRFYEHKTGTGAKWTLAHEPKNVLHWEKFDSQKEAAEREKWFKTGFGRKWLKREYAKCTSVPSPNEGQAGSPAPKCQLRQAGEMVSSELGEIPVGWRVGDINECVSIIIDYRGKTPKKLGMDWSTSGIPALSAKNIKNGNLVREDSMYFGSEELYRKWMKDELRCGDVLLTSEAPLGEVFYLADDKKYILSQRLFALRVNQNITCSYLYTWLKSYQGQFLLGRRATGSTVEGIRQEELRQVEIVIPDNKVIQISNSIWEKIFTKINTNRDQLNSLTKLRDLMLPKLMSGQIRVFE